MYIALTLIHKKCWNILIYIIITYIAIISKIAIIRQINITNISKIKNSIIKCIIGKIINKINIICIICGINGRSITNTNIITSISS
jgi:hypothetical protein